MSATEWLRVGSAVVFLALGVVCIARGGGAPVARSLAAFTLGIFAYLVLEGLSTRTQVRPLTWTENAVATLVMIPAIDVVLGFVGRRRELRTARVVAAVYFVPLAALCLLPFFDPALGSHQEGPVWMGGLLVGIVGIVAFAGFVLAAHYRASAAAERARTQLLGGALLLGFGGAGMTLLHDAGLSVPRELELGLVSSGVLLVALVLRAKLLEGATAIAVVNGLVIALLVVVGEVALYAGLGHVSALFALGSVAVAVAAAVALRALVDNASRARARAEEHATLGRLSAQMAHDLKNPIAAIAGAAELLLEERRAGRSLDGQESYLTLVLEQARRLERVISDYQRLGRVEPRFSPTDLRALVGRVLDAQALAAPERVAVVRPEPGSPVHANVDPDLVAIALEALVRNAFEAIAGDGRVTVEVSAAPSAALLCVSDTGAGMSARTVEQASDPFFTTKAQGSGLGLAYASRVAEAHGTALRIESREGQGTTVTMAFPAG